MRFKEFAETTDIFGFESKKDDFVAPEKIHPMKVFNVELMMEFLSKKRIGLFESNINFMNEIQWGDRYGAVKLDVDPRLTFHITRLGFDLEMQKRWITKKIFQLNRQGYGGYEESVAEEIHDEIERIFNSPLDSPKSDFDQFQGLVIHIAEKMRRTAKPYFIFEQIHKLNNDNYLIKFGVGSQGVEAPNHQQVQEVLTQITYDHHSGTIRLTNYKVESKVGGTQNWAIKPSDTDFYFFPTQSRDEISEAIAVRWKYY